MHFFNEPMPDCVPEFYRAQQEESDRQYELAARRQERYAANRRKIDAVIQAGLPILDFGGYGPCWECPKADHDTVTDDEDDFDCVICHDPSCPEHKNKEANQNER